MYRLVKWNTSAGLFDYPETVNCESDKALDVVTLNILLPVRAEIASLVTSYGWTFLFELIEAATPIAEPVTALNLDGWHPVSPGTISLEAPLREKEDRILEHPRLSYLREMVASFVTGIARIEVGGCLSRVLLEFLDGPLTGATTIEVRNPTLAYVQPDSPFPLFADNQLAYRLSRYPKGLTDPRVRPLRMGFHKPDHVPGPPVVVPLPPPSSHAASLFPSSKMSIGI